MYTQKCWEGGRVPREVCRKDAGQGKKLRKWSRGHQFIVHGGGHIDSWQPLYRYVQNKVVCALPYLTLTFTHSSAYPSYMYMYLLSCTGPSRHF